MIGFGAMELVILGGICATLTLSVAAVVVVAVMAGREK